MYFGANPKAMYGNITKHKVLSNAVSRYSKGVPVEEILLTDEELIKGITLNITSAQAISALAGEDYLRPKGGKWYVTEAGVRAYAKNVFPKENSKLIWAGIRDYGMLIANIAVVIVAIVAIQKDSVDLVKKSDLLEVQTKLNSIESRLLQKDKAASAPTYPRPHLKDTSGGVISP